ncbi:ferredoxin [Stackebrandtia endophytica]|uniref:Ferredoxin n=1 Tax=Stackebrandtia endophytica TaxID=1496996 RepID=A0A543AW40_9ACTN|nr:ferredoxin [Stackebrandtia endophytica]TQL76771.1 ferredoxin [Stackebrandtia endophytica]
MRVTADRERCASAGMCALTAPKVFDQDEVDGRVIVIESAPADEEVKAVTEAIELCPSGALRLRST